MRRLVRCSSVKRHERGGNPRHADDVRAPTIGRDRGYLDDVRATRNQLFKAMCCSHNFLTKDCWELRGFYALRARKQAKRLTKADAQRGGAAFSQLSDAK